MNVEISDETYRAIATTHTDVSAFVEATLRDAVRRSKETKPRFDADKLLSRFQQVQGLFGESSLSETLDSRREGLE